MQMKDTTSGYNPIFEQLVVETKNDSSERLIGMLAYAEYKLDKHEWKQENPNATEEETKSFLSHYNDRVLKKYRTDAENLLLNYAGLYAEDVVNEELEELEEKRFLQELTATKEHIVNHIEKNKTGFWLPVWQGIIASIIFTSILFVLALVVRFAAPDSSAGQILQYLFSPDEYKIKIEKIKK